MSRALTHIKLQHPWACTVEPHKCPGSRVNTTGPQRNTGVAISEHIPANGPEMITWEVWEHRSPTATISLHSENVIRASSKQSKAGGRCEREGNVLGTCSQRKFRARNANIYRNGEVKQRSSRTQTAAQFPPLDPRTLKGGQETL